VFSESRQEIPAAVWLQCICRRIDAAFGVWTACRQHGRDRTRAAPIISLAEQGLCLGGAIPFSMNSRQLTAWMVVGNGSKLMREFFTPNHRQP
jgi:hypothetical protein